MRTFDLAAQVRSDFGKKGARAVKNNDMVPCVLYGGKELKHLQVTNESLRHLIYTPHFHKVMLNIDGAT
ncbi:MAG TPA: hypothetical protein PKD56_09710, partial [Chitinophagales bacterium]|nr:hypothetical protein [Chitinophagales bacterium]